MENVIVHGHDAQSRAILEEVLEHSLPKLFAFFGIKGFSREKHVYIYGRAQAYKEYKLSTSGHYEEWMIGEQKGDELRFLSHKACTETESHRGQTEEDFRKLLIHEFVHACHHELDPEEREETEWFGEVLATVLAEQHDVIPITCSYEDVLYHFENIDLLYETFYTIGAYLLEFVEHETLLTHVREPEMLLREGESIFQKAKAWSNREKQI